jgi:hypothetical protein
MPAVEILNVAVPGELPDEIRAARIRLPEGNAVGGTFAFETFDFVIAGMVLPYEGQAESVELYCADMRLRTLPIKFPRDGLSRSFPDLPDELICGFRSPIGAMTLPPEFELDLRAVLENGNRARIGSITGRRARPRISIEPKLRALQLTSVGRTGTTWMMRMLSAHPGIISHTYHPFETWPARYWAHMLKVLSSPADHISSVTSHSFDQDLWHVGQNPFHFAWPAYTGLREWVGREHVDRLASFCLQNVEDWYAIMAREEGKEPVYFAEKNLLRTPVQGLGVADLYPDTREVFLVRDFRDMACSWLSFRGEVWGEAGFDTDRALQEMVRPWADLLLANWRARKEHAHLLHYEDLVLKPHETLRGLFDFLEIDSADETLDQVMSAGTADQGFTSHRTSPDLQRTVGRWRREGDEAFRAALNDNFRELLDEFGYAEAAAPEPA